MTITIYADVQFSRRKSFSTVYDEKGDALFTSGKLAECLWWCHEMGYWSVLIDNGLHRYRLHIDETLLAAVPLPDDAPAE